MFVVCSTFRVQPESAEDIELLYRMREHLVDDSPGFVGLDVLRNEGDRSEFTLLARWADRPSYEAYRKSDAFSVAHRKMLELTRKARVVSGSHSIKYLEHVAS